MFGVRWKRIKQIKSSNLKLVCVRVRVYLWKVIENSNLTKSSVTSRSDWLRLVWLYVVSRYRKATVPVVRSTETITTILVLVMATKEEAIQTGSAVPGSIHRGCRCRRLALPEIGALVAPMESAARALENGFGFRRSAHRGDRYRRLPLPGSCLTG